MFYTSLKRLKYINKVFKIFFHKITFSLVSIGDCPVSFFSWVSLCTTAFKQHTFCKVPLSMRSWKGGLLCMSLKTNLKYLIKYFHTKQMFSEIASRMHDWTGFTALMKSLVNWCWTRTSNKNMLRIYEDRESLPEEIP